MADLRNTGLRNPSLRNPSLRNRCGFGGVCPAIVPLQETSKCQTPTKRPALSIQPQVRLASPHALQATITRAPMSGLIPHPPLLSGPAAVLAPVSWLPWSSSSSRSWPTRLSATGMTQARCHQQRLTSRSRTTQPLPTPLQKLRQRHPTLRLPMLPLTPSPRRQPNPPHLKPLQPTQPRRHLPTPDLTSLMTTTRGGHLTVSAACNCGDSQC
jgi:hypothetical protein